MRIFAKSVTNNIFGELLAARRPTDKAMRQLIDGGRLFRTALAFLSRRSINISSSVMERCTVSLHGADGTVSPTTHAPNVVVSR